MDKNHLVEEEGEGKSLNFIEQIIEEELAEAFELGNTTRVEGCHVLLVDDVVTSGATIRACMMELSKIKGVRVSVACLGKSGSI